MSKVPTGRPLTENAPVLLVVAKKGEPCTSISVPGWSRRTARTTWYALVPEVNPSRATVPLSVACPAVAVALGVGVIVAVRVGVAVLVGDAVGPPPTGVLVGVAAFGSNR